MANVDDLTKDEEVIDTTTNDASESSLDDMMAVAVEPVQADEESTEEAPSDSSEEKTPEATEEASSDNEVVDEVVEENTQETAEEETTPAASPLPARKDYKGKWYIVHTYSGHENKVARTLMQRVQAMGFEERIYDALVPTRDTIRVRGGKKETIKEKTETVAFIPTKEKLSAEELHINKYFEMDLRKSIFIIAAIFALEFFFYFATMNNYLEHYLKF